MLALIDADVVAYRCAAVNEKADFGLARWQVDQMLSRILEDVDATDWKLYLSGSNNFRYKLYPDYKANRKDMVRPRHLEPLREHLVLEWDAEVTDGYEADDALGMAMGSETIVCSIDKDLKQLHGDHYHFVNRTLDSVSEIDGWRNFYRQLLTGDTADNISGVAGIGPVKATRALEYLFTPWDMYEACRKLYEKAKISLEQMHLNAQLLYIWRKDNDKWEPPTQPAQEPKPSSSPNTTESSSEPTKATMDGIQSAGN